MGDVFDPGVGNPGAERDPTLGMTTDGLLNVALALLLVPGGLSGTMAVLAGVVGVSAIFVDFDTSPDDPPMVVIGIVESLLFAIGAGLYLGAAFGIWRRAKWGWVLGIIGFGLTLGGCCMPFGLFGIYALVREQGRKAFGMA